MKIFLALLLVNLVACVPQQETDFQKFDIASANKDYDFDGTLPDTDPKDEVVEPKTCEDIKYEDACREKEKCQVLLDEFEDKFLSCIPVKEKEDEVVKDKKEETEDAVAKDGQCDEQKDDEKFVIICHIPPGNPEAAHSICIAKQGWLHGHKDRHGREESHDYLGACKGQDLNDYVDPDPVD